MNEMVRIKVAASRLNVSTQTIRNWVTAGKLKVLRHPLNGYRLFEVKEIEALAQSTLCIPTSNTPAETNINKSVTPSFTLEADGEKSIGLETNTSKRPLNHIEESAADYSLADPDLDWLRSTKPKKVYRPLKSVRIGDVFCGGGIFSIGVDEALRSNGMKPIHAFGIDFDKNAIDTFSANFPDSISIHSDIMEITDNVLGVDPSDAEKNFLRKVGGSVDILIGGPPCQGNSDLNNHTRRSDKKNGLFFSMARMTELLNPNFLIIENVPGVIHDKGEVVKKTSSSLEGLGYHVSTAVIDLREIGVPQKRKRFVLVGAKKGRLDIEKVVLKFRVKARSIAWAIDDLKSRYNSEHIFDSSAKHSETNQRRIEYLFSHNIYELPNAERPACHRDKPHSYGSVYGRMKWKEPAPTITGGFGSTGQGRFVHPIFPRTLTPHEASRLQFIPDYFSFPQSVGRRAMQQIIGNAAPPKLSHVLICGAADEGILI